MVIIMVMVWLHFSHISYSVFKANDILTMVILHYITPYFRALNSTIQQQQHQFNVLFVVWILDFGLRLHSFSLSNSITIKLISCSKFRL